MLVKTCSLPNIMIFYDIIHIHVEQWNNKKKKRKKGRVGVIKLGFVVSFIKLVDFGLLVSLFLDIQCFLLIYLCFSHFLK